MSSIHQAAAAGETGNGVVVGLGSPFRRASQVAWQYFDPSDRLSIKRCFRDGLLIYDLNRKHVGVSMRVQTFNREDRAVDPALLVSNLARIQARGVQPEAVSIHQGVKEYPGGAHECEQALLSVVSACAADAWRPAADARPPSLPGVASLTLSGYVPLTPALAPAVGAAFPNISRLALCLAADYDPPRHSGCDHADGAASAVSQLLTACGPRLRELELKGMGRLPAAALQALPLCSGLQRLELHRPQVDVAVTRVASMSAAAAVAAVQADLADLDFTLSVVSQLTSLQSLSVMSSDSRSPLPWPESHRGRTTALACLSALTRLTSLQLQLDHYTHSYSIFYNEPHEQGMMVMDAVPVWREQRRALAAALCGMSLLQHLDVGGVEPLDNIVGISLDAATLKALTGLTFLSAAAVLLPEPEEGSGVAVTHGSVALPPRLVELHLTSDPSVDQVAALDPPPSLAVLRCGSRVVGPALVFDARPMMVAPAVPGPELLPDTAASAAMRAAVGVMRGRVLGGIGPRPSMKLSRYAGHGGWLGELAPLRLTSLKLDQVALGRRDVEALVEACPELTDLELALCALPLEALPLLARLPRLSTLRVDLGRVGPVGALEEAAAERVLLELMGSLPRLKFLNLGGYNYPWVWPLQERLPGLLAAVRERELEFTAGE